MQKEVRGSHEMQPRFLAVAIVLLPASLHALHVTPPGRVARVPRRAAATCSGELSFFGAESQADEACIILPVENFGGAQLPPTFVGTGLQLEELENDEKMLSSITLNSDGSVTLGATTGPLPVSTCGLWQSGGGQFQMTLQRTFQTTSSIDYTVTRIFLGALEETESGPSSIRGRMELLTSLRQDELASRKASPSPVSRCDGEVCCWPPTSFQRHEHSMPAPRSPERSMSAARRCCPWGLPPWDTSR